MPGFAGGVVRLRQRHVVVWRIVAEIGVFPDEYRADGTDLGIVGIGHRDLERRGQIGHDGDRTVRLALGGVFDTHDRQALHAAVDGDHVRAGQVVGTASTTNAIPIRGRSMTSPHLHFAWLNSRKLIQREHGYVPWLDDNGKMIKFANGGEVSARLLTGEHVMNRGASAKYGHVLEAMNNQRYHTGGVVTPSGPKRDTFASAAGGAYNTYHIDVDARGSSLSEQAIVNAVVKAIDEKDKRKGGPRK